MINSVSKALNLLLLVDDAGESGLSLVELADLSGLKVPTAFNLLGTLESEGFLERDAASRRYRIGVKARQLGRRQSLVEQLGEFGARELAPLAGELEETTILAVFHAMHRRTVVALESSHLLRVCAQEGEDQHFYSTATGRILLSMLPEEGLKQLRFLLGEPGDSWPEAQQSMLSATAKIRAEGEVVYFPQKSSQLQALAIPLHLEGAPMASIGVFYPISRHPETEAAKIFLAKMKAAAAIMEQKWRRLRHEV